MNVAQIATSSARRDGAVHEESSGWNGRPHLERPRPGRLRVRDQRRRLGSRTEMIYYTVSRRGTITCLGFITYALPFLTSD